VIFCTAKCAVVRIWEVVTVAQWERRNKIGNTHQPQSISDEGKRRAAAKVAVACIMNATIKWKWEVVERTVERGDVKGQSVGGGWDGVIYPIVWDAEKSKNMKKITSWHRTTTIETRTQQPTKNRLPCWRRRGQRGISGGYHFAMSAWEREEAMQRIVKPWRLVPWR